MVLGLREEFEEGWGKLFGEEGEIGVEQIVAVYVLDVFC